MMVHLHQGDALEFLRSLPDRSADSMVTDPPAGIGFMGREWDKDKGGREHLVSLAASRSRRMRLAATACSAGFSSPRRPSGPESCLYLS